MTAKIGILTVSDRAHRGVYEDLGGPAIHEYLSEVLTNDWEPVAMVVPDEFDQITGALIKMVDDEALQPGRHHRRHRTRRPRHHVPMPPKPSAKR